MLLLNHSFWVTFFFIFLSYTPQFLSYTAPSTRRILHQPFFPLDNIPPSSPPSPPPPSPKLPFSTNNQSPFFPSSYPSPPPPNSPATFASFPANISSLILPQSPSPKPKSQKLLAVAISAVISAIIVLGLVIFYYSRRRRFHRSIDEKAYRSDNSNRIYQTQVSVKANTSKRTRTSSTSSEFLYLGTVVNSHTINDSSRSNNVDESPALDPRKMDSPELQPLPPLRQQQQNQQNYVIGDFSSTADEDEEFYSPRGSIGGRESSNGGGSGSRRVFSAAAVGVCGGGGDGNGADDFDARSCGTSSYTSSSSGSPDRSQSLSISPPVSSSPRLKSPENDTVQVVFQGSPLLASPPLMPLSRERTSPSLSSLSASSPDESPRISFNLERNVQLSSAYSSPYRSPVKSGNASPSILNDLGRNVQSPSLSPAKVFNGLNQNSTKSPALSSVSTSPDRKNLVLDQDLRSPYMSSATTSPDRVSEKNPSPRINLDPNLMSSFLSSASPSPAKGLSKNPLVYPRISNVSDQSKKSSLASSAASSPGRGSERTSTSTPDASPKITYSVFSLNAKISSVLEQPISVPPPPPPPPPPLPPPVQLRHSSPVKQQPQGNWDSPVASTPTGQQIMKPPVLIPPSRPFVLQGGSSAISPMELPPNSKVEENAEETPKPRLKPLHWDKVRASSDREMVWDQLRSSSFKLNEEMMESLFIVNIPNQTTPRSVIPSSNSDNRVLDPKKAQNIAILLRALNVTIEEVCEALLEGNTETLGTELLESLLKMAPTKEEERKLKEYKDDSPTKLGHAEKFLKAVLDVPFAFKRVDAMLYITNFESEVEYLKRSFETLEAACEELRSSRMFMKLLEAVLKTGNRMNVGTNRGDAHAFKLDTLLKLVDVKGADGKTTLLHFVVQEIIRTEGARLSGTNQTPGSTSSDEVKCRKLGLQVVSGLTSELTNVKKAAAMDSDVLSSDVSKLSKGIEDINEIVKLIETMRSNESSQKFSEAMRRFMKMAEEEIIRIQAHESVAMSLVKEITEYFHGNSAKEEAHPFRIFLVVRDFLGIVDRVCKEVGMINERTMVSSAHKFPIPVNPMLAQALGGTNLKQQYNSSDDENAPSP